MKNRKYILPLLFLLVGCNSNSSSSLSSSFNSSSSSNLNSESSTISSSSTSSTSTSSKDLSTNSSSKDSSTSSSSMFISETSFNISDAYNSLSLAMLNDFDYNSITIMKYTFKSDYYQVQNYVMNSYANDITIYNGTTTQTYYSDYSNKISSNFKEQRMYSDGFYTQIKKFNNTFTNSSFRKEMDMDESFLYLNIGQSFNAYQVLNAFDSNYYGFFQGEILEDGNRHGTYFYQDAADDTGYAFTAALEISIDKDFYLTDFYYSEGYYDTYFIDDVESARKHGPSPYGDGYTYEIVRSVKAEKVDYQSSLPFALEDNFISSLEFKETEITLKISDYTNKYINLVDYIRANVDIGFINGAPVNNLQFTSSNSSVIKIGDRYYADFIAPGETIITVLDGAYGVNGSNFMKIILEE